MTQHTYDTKKRKKTGRIHAVTCRPFFGNPKIAEAFVHTTAIEKVQLNA
jgi:hypothetical protein